MGGGQRQGKPTSGDHDSPGLRLPLNQPPVPPPLGVGAEMVCQLPAKLLHGAQCITFLQRQPQVSGWGVPVSLEQGKVDPGPHLQLLVLKEEHDTPRLS